MSDTQVAAFISPDALLQHWQGHRRLTRRVIEAFPEDQLFTFAVGGMRPFGTLAIELLGMAEPTVRGIATGSWEMAAAEPPADLQELLAQWDRSTAAMDELWPQIPAARFQEVDTAFGQYEGIVHDLVLYIIDNEIHHRGQGYVYLRALGVEPPAFFERH